ncbi:hypothetical protein Q3G72_017538 [Acer saccharum]|nr:hypothetical protein Q3G72_017538 [Acer saccharum]
MVALEVEVYWRRAVVMEEGRVETEEEEVEKEEMKEDENVGLRVVLKKVRVKTKVKKVGTDRKRKPESPVPNRTEIAITYPNTLPTSCKLIALNFLSSKLDMILPWKYKLRLPNDALNGLFWFPNDALEPSRRNYSMNIIFHLDNYYIYQLREVPYQLTPPTW